MNRLYNRAAAVFLAAAALLGLGGCIPRQAAEPPEVSEDIQPSEPVAETIAADLIFTVRYDAGFSFNPITGTNPDNMALVPLMYEGLFVLNGGMSPQPVLCDKFETSDGIHYTFYLKPDIAMCDGSTLTAADVKYTLAKAAQTGRYAGRLGNIDTITADSGLKLSVTLKSANYKLPSLLDIPIIKSGSIDSNHPPGTGPFYFDTSDTPRLVAFPDYRYYGSLPITTVYLKQCSDTELSILFSSQAVDLFWDDPADVTDIIILSDHEVRYYTTTILQYVGFNTNNRVLSNPDMRRALGLTIDRKDIAGTVYSAHADAAPLILSPKYALYDAAREEKSLDPIDEISAIFSSIGPRGLEDTDNNGYLEYPDSGGSNAPFSLKFIVNGDNKYKVAAAEKITASMKAVGIDVELRKLPWDDYMDALQNGNFDMYYADIYLPADYDLSALLSPGGPDDYGHAGSSEYSARIRNFLSAKSGSQAETDAAKALCAYVGEKAPIIPVLYRQYAIHTNRNVVSGLTPTQSSLYFGLTGWTVNLSQK